MRFDDPAQNAPVFRSAFMSPNDGETGLGIRPVVFDILGPDLETSLLPPDIRMVLHVNPGTMSVQYEKLIERIQTKGGFVEQHWGEGARSVDFTQATGGFKRLYTGLSNITGGGINTYGTRRETIAYDKYLDLLALFHNNGSVYDTTGQIVFQGIIKILFDGGVFLGWFNNFVVMETAERGYQFELTSSFTVKQELLRFRSLPYPPLGTQSAARQPAQSPVVNTPRAIGSAEGAILAGDPLPQSAPGRSGTTGLRPSLTGFEVA